MPPAEQRTRRIERAAMLLQIGPLDEIAAILLVDRHEHVDDVAQQVAAAFRNAVQEHRLAQRRLREAAVLLIERIGFHEHFGHDSPLSWRLKKTGRSEEHTSEIKSLMRSTYAVSCLTKKRPQLLRSQK